VDGAWQGERREISAALLAEADALVFPSDFLLRAHRDLFPGLPVGRTRIIAPATPGQALPPRPPRPLRHIALVGGVQAHKGALVFADVVRLLKGSGLRWSAYGGGDAALATQLRSIRGIGIGGIRVRGAYRHGSLPRLLRRDGVDLALLLSIVPESYSLALGECVQAGVPVLAFALGALADRVPQLGAGRLIPPEQGAEGIAEEIRAMLREGRTPEIPADAATQIPGADDTAAAYQDLYQALAQTSRALQGRPL
jgi:glycosyltransferase involved in cell wall biosynthesis